MSGLVLSRFELWEITFASFKVRQNFEKLIRQSYGTPFRKDLPLVHLVFLKAIYLATWQYVSHSFCFPANYFHMGIRWHILSCPSKSNSKQIELTVHTSCYWGLRLTLCYFQKEITLCFFSFGDLTLFLGKIQKHGVTKGKMACSSILKSLDQIYYSFHFFSLTTLCCF